MSKNIVLFGTISLTWVGRVVLRAECNGTMLPYIQGSTRNWTSYRPDVWLITGCDCCISFHIVFISFFCIAPCAADFMPISTRCWTLNSVSSEDNNYKYWVAFSFLSGRFWAKGLTLRVLRNFKLMKFMACATRTVKFVRVETQTTNPPPHTTTYYCIRCSGSTAFTFRSQRNPSHSFCASAFGNQPGFGELAPGRIGGIGRQLVNLLCWLFCIAPCTADLMPISTRCWTLNSVSIAKTIITKYCPARFQSTDAPIGVVPQDDILLALVASSSRTIETLLWSQVFLFCGLCSHKKRMTAMTPGHRGTNSCHWFILVIIVKSSVRYWSVRALSGHCRVTRACKIEVNESRDLWFRILKVWKFHIELSPGAGHPKTHFTRTDSEKGSWSRHQSMCVSASWTIHRSGL